MKRSIFKKIGTIALSAMMAGSICAVAGCSNTGNTPGGNTPSGGSGGTKILVGVQQTRGNNYEAMCKFLDALKPELNFTYDIQLMDRSDNNNVILLENAILKGVSGIITMTEMAASVTQGIINLCEQEGVYYAGYMSDFWKTYSDANLSGKKPKDSKYCLGSVSDGELDSETRATWLFETVKKSPYRKIVLTRAPEYAYPSSVAASEVFKGLVDEYNATAADGDKFELWTKGVTKGAAFQIDYGLPTSFASTVTEWQNWGGDDLALVGLNYCAGNIMGISSYNDQRFPIFNVGWDDDVSKEFGSLTDASKPVKALCQTPCETIIYPLVRMLNAINGTPYADEPTKPEDRIIEAKYCHIESPQDITDGSTHCLNFNDARDLKYALISPSEVKGLLAANGGTFAQLKETISTWNTEYILRREIK